MTPCSLASVLAPRRAASSSGCNFVTAGVSSWRVTPSGTSPPSTSLESPLTAPMIRPGSCPQIARTTATATAAARITTSTPHLLEMRGPVGRQGLPDAAAGGSDGGTVTARWGAVSVVGLAEYLISVLMAVQSTPPGVGKASPLLHNSPSVRPGRSRDMYVWWST